MTYPKFYEHSDLEFAALQAQAVAEEAADVAALKANRLSVLCERIQHLEALAVWAGRQRKLRQNDGAVETLLTARALADDIHSRIDVLVRKYQAA
jgi:hypothetical protein